MTPPNPEAIYGAAISCEGGVYVVPPPKRHHHLFQSFGPLYGEQGFLTTAGRFVDRDEAWPIAEAAGQCVNDHVGPERHLFSEDLW